MKLRPPSPALVISVIALVVACAGTAYAATKITSSRQIKNGVVTGGDIRDRSIQGRDIKNRTITSIKLARGVANTGSSAAAGAGTALEAFRKAGPESQPANVVVKVATLTVPAGAYSISAKTVMTAIGGRTNLIEALLDAPASLGGHCKLDAAGDTDESRATIVVRDNPSPSTLQMQLTRTVPGPSNFDLLCDAAAPWRTSDTSIIATKLTSVARAESTG
ncbi:MAG: hypothetical protein M3296_04285 [Actinomycetota bacterium]|nr:hypothetical protein [Actinomycetota bacterium]